MKLVYIVNRIKNARTVFGNYVGGAAELDVALKNTLKKDCAFVVPISDNCQVNLLDNGMGQTITERFSVVVAVANDTTDKDKIGNIAYDSLHDIRSELFRSLLGWQIEGAESLIYYAGGKFVTINNGYLWWEYDFEYRIRLRDYDGYCDIVEQGDFIENKQQSQLDSFDGIYSKYIIWPNENLPWKGTVGDITSDMTQMETWVDLTQNPNDGSYGRGFGSEFDFYRVLNRKNDPK